MPVLKAVIPSPADLRQTLSPALPGVALYLPRRNTMPRRIVPSRYSPAWALLGLPL